MERNYMHGLLVMCVLACSLSVPVETSCVTTEGWNPAQCFTMFPEGDVLLEVGHDLELNCSVKREYQESLSTITELPFTAHNLSIRRGTRQLPADLFTVYEEEMTLQLRIPDAETQAEFYSCYYQEIRVGGKYVQVKKIPRPGSVECVSHNFLNLSCYFHVDEGSDIAPMKWTMNFRYNPTGMLSNKTNCDEEVTGVYNRVCHVPEGHIMYFHQFVGNMTGIWKSDNGVALHPPVYTTPPFQFFITYSIVKLFPVRNLQVATTVRSTNVTLMWAYPPSIQVRDDTFYEIRTMSPWGNQTETIQSSSNVTRFTADRLVPDTSYSALVRCRLAVTKDTEMYWSKWTSLSFTTPQDVPFHPVTVAAFMYEMDNCDPNRLCLVIYWKNPDSRWSNGHLTNYELMLHPSAILSSNNQSSAMEVFGRQIMALFDTQLLSNQTYILQMKVATKIGYSEFSKPVIVPDLQTGNQLQADWVLVELDAVQQRVHVTWKAKPEWAADVVNVTYFRCIDQVAERNTTSYIKCKEEVDWVTVPLQKDSVNGSHWWDWVDNQSDARYAVSLTTTDGLSGGLTWEKYRYNVYDTAPESPLYMAKVITPDQSGVDTEELNVTILYPTHYSSNGGRPDMYMVTYQDIGNSQTPDCPDGGVEKSFPVNFTSHELRLRDLTAGSRYVVCVRSQNSAGQSDYGEPVIVKLDGESDSNTGVIVAVTISSTVVLVGIIGLLICCIRRARKMDKLLIVNTQEFDLSIEKNSMNFRTLNDGVGYINLEHTPEVMEADDSDSGKGASLEAGYEKVDDLSQDKKSISSQTSSALPGYERLPDNDYTGSDHDSVISKQNECEFSDVGHSVIADGQNNESTPPLQGHDNPSFSETSLRLETNGSEASAAVDCANRENRLMPSEWMEGTKPLCKDVCLNEENVNRFDAEAAEICHESPQHDNKAVEMCVQVEGDNVLTGTLETVSSSDKEEGLLEESNQKVQSLMNADFINENRVITETPEDSNCSDDKVIGSFVGPEDASLDEFEELPGYNHTVDFSFDTSESDTRTEPFAASDTNSNGSGMCGDVQGYQAAYLIDMDVNLDSGAIDEEQSRSHVEEIRTLGKDVNKQQSDIALDNVHNVPATCPIIEQGEMHKEFKGDSDKTSETIRSKTKPEIIKMHNSVSEDESELEAYVEAHRKEALTMST